MLTFSIKHYRVFDVLKKAAVLFSAYQTYNISLYITIYKIKIFDKKEQSLCGLQVFFFVFNY